MQNPDLNWMQVNILFLFVLLLLGAASNLQACGIVCAPLPKKTVVDHLLENDTVVLAREDSERPFFYMPVEILKGKPLAGSIDLFLDSSTRNRLRSYASDTVMLGRKSNGDWFRIAYVDTGYRSIVVSILQRLPSWEGKPEWKEERFLFFVDLLGHENRQIHELAYIEVGRAPYKVIRNLRGVVSRKATYRELSNYRYRAWHPLYLLMLGASGNEEDCNYIANKLEQLQKYSGVTNLSALATAYVECTREKGISKLETLYFDREIRTRSEIEAIQAAFSEYGNGGHRDLRDAIVASYESLLEAHPKLASQVARDLLAWDRTELVGQLTKILHHQYATNPLGGYYIRLYLKRNQHGSNGK